MTAENIVSRPRTGLERVVRRFDAPDALARLEAFVELTQRDPSSAALILGRKGVVRESPSENNED